MKCQLCLFALFAFAAQLAFAEKDEQKLRAEIARRGNEIDMGDVDDYDITNPTTEIHNNQEWKNLSPEDRRKMAVEFYYSMIGLCKKKNIKNCQPSDAQFIAKAYARGDPECFFYCGYDKMKENANKLPGQYTLALAIDVGLDWHKEVKDIDDMETLDRGGRQAAGAMSKKSAKRIIIFPIVFAALSAIINIGSMAAIGYFSNDRNLDDMSRVGGKAGQIRAALTPALKVTRATRGCFDVKGIVNVQDGQGSKYSKKIGDLKVGDQVESVDDNGNIVFSNVYYIAHGDGEKRAKLLRVYYEGNAPEMESIGLSERHLIYATKADSELDAVKAKPVMASQLSKGDYVWVQDNSELVAKKVSVVLPYVGNVIHPLTDNHHIIVNGVHASVHIINESAYRIMTAPLKWVCWMSPEAGESKLVNKLVRLVEDAKEPFASNTLGSVFQKRDVHMGIYGMSEA
eukprot:gene12960-3723_t